MENILQWGLELIRTIQSFSSVPLTAVMRTITWLGDAAGYVIVLPLIYWCVDEKKGVRLGLTVLVSAWINISLKYLFNQPRPFFEAFDPSVAMIPERLGGLPSGHAQNSLVMWIIIASWGKKKWMYAAAAGICLLVSFSRVYLGVHFPSDILGGWILGGLVLGAYFVITRQLEKEPDGEGAAGGNSLKALLERGGFRAEMIIAAAAAFVMILYRPGDEALLFSGMLFGTAAGYSLNRRYIGFKSAPPPDRTGVVKYGVLLFRFLAGIAGTFVVLAAFSKLVPKDPGAAYYALFYFVRFVITALWVYAGAPRLYQLLRLAEVKEKS